MTDQPQGWAQVLPSLALDRPLPFPPILSGQSLCLQTPQACGQAGRLTCHSEGRDGPQPLSSSQPIEQKLVLAAWLQTLYGDLVLVCSHDHCLGLPIPISVLDQEGVKGALGHRPREVQRVSRLSGHCQFTEAGLRRLLQGG